MAAYAALASLMNLIEQIHHHPQPPITLDKDQTQSLNEKIAFLQDFLEAYNRHYSNQEVERLRIRIAEAAYATEDLIESLIVDQILARRDQTSSADLCQSQQRAEENIIESTSTHDADKIYSAYLYQGMQKVLEEMDLVKKDVDEIKEKLGTQEQLQRIITAPVVSPKSPSTEHNIMVGFDDVLHELLHKLTGQPNSHRQIIPISGMAGIGKTTLVKSLYTNPLIEHHFHVLAWVTISKEYNMKEILLELICQSNQGSNESLSQMSEEEKKLREKALTEKKILEKARLKKKLREKFQIEKKIGQQLYKSLYGRRYLIVMDDVWSDDVWDKVKLYFPNTNHGSRIIVTTRLSNVTSYLSSGCGHEMDFLDQDKSWNLFCKTVFGKEEDCPPELEDIGMEIARNCKGLPLSIVVIGGLLSKSKPRREYWAYILDNVSSIVNLEDSERCLKILHTSYDELPVQLKACFLYMRIFREDSKIHVPTLINMWVAEGFLKPISGKSLEESGEEYLMDLVDRNLILISKRGYSGNLVFCNIHDLMRDLCLREAQKEKFFISANQHDVEGINTQRRIIIYQYISEKKCQILQSASSARTLISYFDGDFPLDGFRSLRVLKWIGDGRHILEDSFQQVNMRYIDVPIHYRYLTISSNMVFKLSCDTFMSPQLWNLQTLIFSGQGGRFAASCEIWKMPLLRHVESFKLTLSDPPSGPTDEFVLHYLHTLMEVVNLKFGEEVVKRIPNVKKLKLRYQNASDYCLNNLVHLYKLEYLECRFSNTYALLPNVIFPHSLKELSLRATRLSWEDMNTKIGSLPHLQALKLYWVSVTTSEWETIEGQFCRLKYLSIARCENWKYWNAESSHFPCLEHLVLDGLYQLKQIPCGIGDIATLKSIQLDHCSYSAIFSAKQIVDEQEEFGDESLQVSVLLYKLYLRRKEYQGVESLRSHNFQVKIDNRY